MQGSETLPIYELSDKLLVKKWKPPQKRIFSAVDIPSFQSSKAIANINGIVSLICTKISLVDVPAGALDDKLVDFSSKGYLKGGKVSTEKLSTKDASAGTRPPKFTTEVDSKNYLHITTALLTILEKFTELKIETPPFPGPRRYGNFACRDWHDKLTSNIDSILDDAFKPLLNGDEISDNYLGMKSEIKYYLLGSFGSRERLDYGTGHELSFVSFLGCLVMVKLIDRNKLTGSEWLIVLSKYYDLVKSLILSYTLEPAGSHGVWGLDDHFHLAYVFGACQLVDFKTLANNSDSNLSDIPVKVLNYRMGLTPSSILNPETLERERDKNLYYNAISFIKMVKVGPFSEHSPILYEVSASKNWEKIARGMLRMYYGEVLSKFPVVQHFYFGGVFYPWVDKNGKELPSSEGQSETPIEPNGGAEAFKGTEGSNRYDETVTSTMGTFYPQREGELSKLLEERRKMGTSGRMGGENMASSKPPGLNEQRHRHNHNMDNETKVPWDTKNRGAVDRSGFTGDAGTKASWK